MTVKERFDILLVVPLEEELMEVQKIFPAKRNLSTDTGYRFEHESGEVDISMLVVQQEAMGKQAAHDAVADNLAEFDIRLVVCLGIAGSLTGDLSLCDVCYSEGVIDVYDNSKVSDGKAGGTDLAFAPTFKDSPRALVAAMNSLRTFPELQPAYAAWRAERGAIAGGLFPAPVVGRKGAPETIGEPKSKNGKVACAAVSKGEEYNSKIRGIDRKVLAIETEAGGIFAAAGRKGVDALAIRGISDHADESKGQLEAATGGKIRAFAAENAASFLRLQFANPNFKEWLGRYRSGPQLDLGLNGERPSQARQLTAVIADFSATIDGKLREFCPEYKLLEKGYRLPVPRMRGVQVAGGIARRFSSDPEEVREALERHEAILLGLSKNYPDYSLPWVIANDLLTAVVGGKQMIPVVVDGDAVRPPRLGLDQAAHYEFADVKDIPGTQIVYIIDGVPLSSKSRIEFLIKQMKERPDARFIILTRDETHIIAESKFAASVKAEFFQLGSVSFLEIAHFVEKNFGMTALEAEVVALRLNNTFRDFDLSAHPTYFAGISKEVLFALLQANRRAELIQLAVDGFLSLVVADDKASVTLSRTTRSRFLRMLTLEIRVEKRAVTRDEVVAIARDYAKEYDFEVDPAAFVASFVESGILHFYEDRVQFSLPFVESYLLAAELADAPDKAQRYFNVANDDFDVGTFDLYCEIRPDPSVVEAVIAAVAKDRQSTAVPGGKRHILLTDAVRPAMLAHPARLEAIQERFNKLSDDVRSGRGDVKRKQRMLDVADRVKEIASDRAHRREDETDGEGPDVELAFEEAVRHWVIASTMLGAAAEHLRAETKQELATGLIDLAASLAHVWTEAYTRIDFEEIRKEFTSDEVVKSIQNGSGDAGDEAETRKNLGSMVDLLEFSMFAFPLRRLLSHLCETARLRVLATSVERAEVSGEVQGVLHAAWLADIEGRRGHRKLMAVVKELPSSPFLRIVIATHLMTRVYWNQWDKDDRLRLLDAAELALKPFVTLKKGEIIRYIEENSGKANEASANPVKGSAGKAT